MAQSNPPDYDSDYPHHILYFSVVNDDFVIFIIWAISGDLSFEYLRVSDCLHVSDGLRISAYGIVSPAVSGRHQRVRDSPNFVHFVFTLVLGRHITSHWAYIQNITVSDSFLSILYVCFPSRIDVLPILILLRLGAYQR